jgi:hypothetical protein
MVKNPINQQENNFRHIAATAKNKMVSEAVNDDLHEKEVTGVAFAVDNDKVATNILLDDKTAYSSL